MLYNDAEDALLADKQTLTEDMTSHKFDIRDLPSSELTFIFVSSCKQPYCDFISAL